jgi:hypothetical protein
MCIREVEFINCNARAVKLRTQDKLGGLAMNDFKNFLAIMCVYGNGKSRFAQHLLDAKYSIGPVENMVYVVCITYKGIHMNRMEAFYIYVYIRLYIERERETKVDNQINDKNTVMKLCNATQSFRTTLS